MMPFISRLILLVSLFSFSSFSNDWDPNNEVPKITIIGEHTKPEIEAAETLRLKLVEVLNYWKGIGLQDPPDMEGIYYFTSYDEMKVEKVLNLMNPQFDGNVEKIILDEYEFFKTTALYKQLNKKAGIFSKFAPGFMKEIIEELNNSELLRGSQMSFAASANPGEQFYSQLVMIRFGLSTSNIIQALESDLTFKQVEDMGAKIDGLHQDNAYFIRAPKFKITDMLVTEEEARSGKYKGQTFKKSFEELMSSSDDSKFKRRIVLLPRTSEKVGDLEVSTLKDMSITPHEDGHLIVSSLAKNGQYHRNPNEIFADYFYYAATDDPNIGAFFAAASGVIAERIKEKGELANPTERAMARHLNSMASRGFLRSFADFHDNYSLTRNTAPVNDYDGGNPSRFALHQIRTDSRVNPAALDRVVLDSINEFSRLPYLETKRSKMYLWFRSIGFMAKSFLAKRKELKALRDLVPEAELIKIEKQANAMATQYLYKYISEKRAKLSKIKSKKEMEERLAKQYNSLFKKIKKQLVEQYNTPIAAENMRNNDKALEERKAKYARANYEKEVVARPAVSSDYVIPEYYRTLYRVAKNKGEHELAAVLIEKASENLLSYPLELQTDSGTDEVVFLRKKSQTQNSSIKNHLTSVLSELEELNIVLNNDELVKKMPQNEFDNLAKKYRVGLDKLSEFQRQGSRVRLTFPYPAFRFFEVSHKYVVNPALFLVKLGYKIAVYPFKLIYQGYKYLRGDNKAPELPSGPKNCNGLY